MTKKIGVITVTYNSKNVIEAFLDSILNQTYSDFILYVVDNISQD
ncbi:MAG: glycosyltransferase, partial [Bacteroidetes bacterium]|nr:glycosyltransferase [Bacteroidota bacterium]